MYRDLYVEPSLLPAYTIHTLYTNYSDTEIHPGGFMLGRTDYSATQRRRATIFRPATAAAHLTYDRHISERQSLNTIFTRGNSSIGINCIQRAVVYCPFVQPSGRDM